MAGLFKETEKRKKVKVGSDLCDFMNIWQVCKIKKYWFNFYRKKCGFFGHFEGICKKKKKGTIKIYVRNSEIFFFGCRLK